MGHDISPIGNHQLNTANVETLAKDIVSRIDINIEYGYFMQKEHFNLLGMQKEDELVILDTIIKNPNYKTFRLIDESYQLKELHKHFGDDLFNMPEYWMFDSGQLPDSETILKEKEGLIHPNYHLEWYHEGEYEWMFFYKEHYENDVAYYSRWWDFCRLFGLFNNLTQQI